MVIIIVLFNNSREGEREQVCTSLCQTFTYIWMFIIEAGNTFVALIQPRKSHHFILLVIS